MAEVSFDPVLDLTIECDATRRFVDLLQREQFILRQADVSALDPLTEEKTFHLQQLSQLDGKRRRWLAAQGYSADRDGVERALHDCNGTTDILAELLDLAKTAVQLNRINGLLIEQWLRHNEQLLGAMRAAIQPTSLYGANGQARLHCPGRPLGEG